MNNKRYVNEKKVTDHYAIIPTEQVTNPSRLSGDEKENLRYDRKKAYCDSL